MTDPGGVLGDRVDALVADLRATTTAADLAGEDVWYDPRLDDDVSGYVQTFTVTELVAGQ